mmetsp:Transcript_25051/g.38877  ORF Transcript_25051/g.38877 Transcript_25051/m.38877 type:complete len:106 (+) Transcript_25051:114-431(+)
MLQDPESSSKVALQDIEYFFEGMKDAFGEASPFEGKIACNLCSDALTPLDKLLENKFVTKVLDFISLMVCEHFGIEGGQKSVCKGAIDMMSVQLLPAVAEGILSP